MADEPADDTEIDDTLDLDPEDILDPQDDPDAESEDDEELTVSFGDDAATDKPDDNATIRRMREELRKARAEAAEARKSAAPAKVEIGEKPTLASCDFDEDAFDAAYDEWKDAKAQVERQQTERAKQDEQVQQQWQADLASLETKKATLAAVDYDEAEEAVKADLDLVQQAVIVKAANDPAALIYAIGKNDAKRAELAKINDPIKLAAAIARLEATVKVVRGKKAPAPDRPANGSSSMPGGPDKELERLQKKADETGERTELRKYKAKLKEREQARNRG